MSDFFGDDFTAELKSYFLTQFHSEIEKYLQAVDPESWQVFRDEIQEKSKEWIVDARTNEFSYFADWFENTALMLGECQDVKFFSHCLTQVSGYLQELLAQKKDSEALAQQFNVASAQNNSQLYLHCRIDGQDVVLPVQFVVEVVGEKSISPLPRPVPGVSGMMPYRGEAVPVFNFNEASESKENVSYVICDVDKQLFAVQVTQVDQLFEIKEQELQNKNSTGNLFPNDIISHFVLRDNKNMMVFDLQRLVAA